MAGGKTKEGCKMSEQQLIVTSRGVSFPKGGYLSTHITDPAPNGRVLVEVRGHSGKSSWTEALFTVPQDALRPTEDFWSECELVDGVYKVEETQDKRGQRLLRLFRHDGDAEFVLFSVPGFVVRSACEGEVIVLAKAEGNSRTGRNGDRWSLVAARPNAVVAYEGYHDRPGDPTYVRVTWDGLQTLGESTATLPPSEW
jgi:hypothetical protein